jgi:hypothetical protein
MAVPCRGHTKEISGRCIMHILLLDSGKIEVWVTSLLAAKDSRSWSNRVTFGMPRCCRTPNSESVIYLLRSKFKYLSEK